MVFLEIFVDFTDSFVEFTHCFVDYGRVRHLRASSKIFTNFEVLGPLAKLRFFLLNLRTFLSIFGATNVYALPLKFLKSLPADFFPHLV